jgi:hypothetical protein
LKAETMIGPTWRYPSFSGLFTRQRVGEFNSTQLRVNAHKSAFNLSIAALKSCVVIFWFHVSYGEAAGVPPARSSRIDPSRENLN